jgi:hypothetical protein
VIISVAHLDMVTFLAPIGMRYGATFPSLVDGLDGPDATIPPMRDETAADRCPGCGQPVTPGEDYVLAREHRLEPDVALHAKRSDRSDGVERRFHVGHFRGQLGNCFYELVASEHHRSQ